MNCNKDTKDKGQSLRINDCQRLLRNYCFVKAIIQTSVHVKYYSLDQLNRVKGVKYYFIVHCI